MEGAAGVPVKGRRPEIWACMPGLQSRRESQPEVLRARGRRKKRWKKALIDGAELSDTEQDER